MELIATSGVTAADRTAARLEKTAQDLQAYADQPSAVTMAAVHADMQWLEATQQLPDLASRIRSQFNQPNVQFKIQSDLVARALSDTATQTDPVAMCFYGSWVTGTSRGNVNYRGRLCRRRMPR